MHEHVNVDAYAHGQTESFETEKATPIDGSVIVEVDVHVDIDVLVLVDVDVDVDGLEFLISMNDARVAGALR